jgi:DNA-binding LacI/PurR family transcriptional regulator
VLKRLEDENLIDRIHGTGTYVSQKEKIAPHRISPVGTIIPTRGDIYGEMFNKLVQQLEIKNINTIPMATDFLSSQNMSIKEFDSLIDRFSANHFHSLVVWGSKFFPFKSLKKFVDRFQQLIFVLNYETDMQFKNANYIITDFEASGYKVAKRLLERECQNLVFMTYTDWTGYDELLGSAHYVDTCIASGIKKAIAKFNGSAHFIKVMENQKDAFFEHIPHKMKTGKLGIVCHGDARALPVYHWALANKLKIGKDFDVIGYYNTPWSRALQPQLTTVDVKEREIADLAVKIVLERSKNKKIILTPSIVEGQSG